MSSGDKKTWHTRLIDPLDHLIYTETGDARGSSQEAGMSAVLGLPLKPAAVPSISGELLLADSLTFDADDREINPQNPAHQHLPGRNTNAAHYHFIPSYLRMLNETLMHPSPNPQIVEGLVTVLDEIINQLHDTYGPLRANAAAIYASRLKGS